MNSGRDERTLDNASGVILSNAGDGPCGEAGLGCVSWATPLSCVAISLSFSPALSLCPTTTVPPRVADVLSRVRRWNSTLSLSVLCVSVEYSCLCNAGLRCLAPPPCTPSVRSACAFFGLSDADADADYEYLYTTIRGTVLYHSTTSQKMS